MYDDLFDKFITSDACIYVFVGLALGYLSVVAYVMMTSPSI